MNNILFQALDAFKAAVGVEWVSSSTDSLTLAEIATFKTNQKISVIIQPKNVEEVCLCMKIANQYRLSVYPISCGKNWGYGSKVPVESVAILLDLHRMNRIIEFNEQLAYVVVEPGVTQAQLLAFLKEKTNGRLWLDTVASSPHTSLIGNALERGHGTTPYCDRAANCSDFQVVLANGDLINTGYGAFPDCKTKNLDFWGLGPAISALFSQSNFGIVTKMSLMLYPAPDCMKIAIFSTDSDVQLAQFIEWANLARLKNILKAGPYISNHFVSLLRVMEQYPWDLMHNETPLHQEMVEHLRAVYKIRKWSAVFGLWGTQSEVAALESYVKQTSSAFGTVTFWDQSALEQNNSLSKKSKNDLLNLCKQMSGNITGLGLSRAYWRKTAAIEQKNIDTIDLDKDKCGFLSINPAVPFQSKDFFTAARLSHEIISQHGFEPNIAAYATRPRILQFHITLCFDRNNAAEDARALECLDVLVKKLQEHGFYSFRLNIASMNQFSSAESSYLKLVNAIKHVFDPLNIIAPGRYSSHSAPT